MIKVVLDWRNKQGQTVNSEDGDTPTIAFIDIQDEARTHFSILKGDVITVLDIIGDDEVRR